MLRNWIVQDSRQYHMIPKPISVRHMMGLWWQFGTVNERSDNLPYFTKNMQYMLMWHKSQFIICKILYVYVEMITKIALFNGSCPLIKKKPVSKLNCLLLSPKKSKPIQQLPIPFYFLYCAHNSIWTPSSGLKLDVCHTTFFVKPY